MNRPKFDELVPGIDPDRFLEATVSLVRRMLDAGWEVSWNGERYLAKHPLLEEYLGRNGIGVVEAETFDELYRRTMRKEFERAFPLLLARTTRPARKDDGRGGWKKLGG